jgi:hypothetical protein
MFQTKTSYAQRKKEMKYFIIPVLVALTLVIICQSIQVLDLDDQLKKLSEANSNLFQADNRLQQADKALEAEADSLLGSMKFRLSIAQPGDYEMTVISPTEFNLERVR